MEELDYRITLGHLNRALPYAGTGDDGVVTGSITGAVHAVVIPSTSLETFREQYRIEDMKTAELPQTLGLSAYVAKGNASCSPC